MTEKNESTIEQRVEAIRRSANLSAEFTRLRDEHDRIAAAIVADGAAGLKKITPEFIARRTQFELSSAAFAADRAAFREHAAAVAGEIDRRLAALENLLKDVFRLTVEATKRRLAPVADLFPADQLDGIVARTTAVRHAAAFCAERQIASGLDRVFESGIPVLSPEVTPGHVLASWDKVNAALLEAKVKLAEIKKGGAS